MKTTRSRLLVASCSKYCQMPRKKRLPVLKTHPRNASYLNPSRKRRPYRSPSQGYLLVTNPTNVCLKKKFVSNATVAKNALWMLLPAFQAQIYRKWRRKTTGQKSLVNSAKQLITLMKTTWRNSFVTNLNTPFMIGNVEIPNRTFLAPMAGVTNSAFRTIAKELGAGTCCHGNGLWQGNPIQQRKTLHMLHIDEGENPVSIQLLVATKTA